MNTYIINKKYNISEGKHKMINVATKGKLD